MTIPIGGGASLVALRGVSTLSNTLARDVTIQDVGDISKCQVRMLGVYRAGFDGTYSGAINLIDSTTLRVNVSKSESGINVSWEISYEA